MWAEAEKQWKAMPESDRQAMINSKKKEFRTAVAQIRDRAVNEGFAGTFSPVDIVFFLLGVVTAWQVAFRDVVGGEG